MEIARVGKWIAGGRRPVERGGAAGRLHPGNKKRRAIRSRLGLSILLGVMLSGMIGPAAWGEMFRWVDEQGKTHFGDRPPPESRVEEVDVRINTYEAPTIVPSTPVESSGTKRKSNRRVVMYSASWCGVCKKARDYFRQNGVTFTEYDVETSTKGKRDYKTLRGKGVPIILVGTQRMNGFSARKFEMMYKGS